MAKGLVVYYSRSGNTEQMAFVIAEAMNEAGLTTKCQKVKDTSVEELLAVEAIVIGSPTYYGQMSWQIKKLFDDSVKEHSRLEGKVGAAFSSAANIGGGNETTIVSILEMMLIHGMVVQGDSHGDHYGPVSIGKPDERVTNQCKRRGAKVAELTKRLFSC